MRVRSVENKPKKAGISTRSLMYTCGLNVFLPYETVGLFDCSQKYGVIAGEG